MRMHMQLSTLAAPLLPPEKCKDDGTWVWDMLYGQIRSPAQRVLYTPPPTLPTPYCATFEVRDDAHRSLFKKCMRRPNLLGAL